MINIMAEHRGLGILSITSRDLKFEKQTVGSNELQTATFILFEKLLPSLKNYILYWFSSVWSLERYS